MRPLYLSIVIYILLAPLCYAETDSVAKNSTILVLGDSLSAGFGIDQSQNWVNLLSERLRENGFTHKVYNASISGETSLGGLNRLPGILEKRPEIVIIELGANDGLRGLPLDHLRNNLDQMIILSKSTGAEILLIGMRLPPNYGPAYTNGFQDMYKILAKKHNVMLVPFLLEGIATRRDLMQDDNLHPTSEAQTLILNNVWPYFISLINKH